MGLASAGAPAGDGLRRPASRARLLYKTPGPPDGEEYVPDQVLRPRFVTHQPQHEPVHPHVVPCEQHLHGEPVAACDPRDQNVVRSRLHRQANRLVS